jgi:hypothetical protein
MTSQFAVGSRSRHMAQSVTGYRRGWLHAASESSCPAAPGLSGLGGPEGLRVSANVLLVEQTFTVKLSPGPGPGAAWRISGSITPGPG